MRRFSLLLVAALAAVSVGQTPKNNAFGTKLKSVAVFRDGFGYYVREGQVKLDNGWATTDFVPTAIKGTVWFYSVDPADQIDTVVTSKENKIEFSSPADLKAKLKDKVGLRLIVITRGGQRFEGELAKAPDDMVLIKSGDAYNAVALEQVQSVQLAGYPVRLKINTKDPNKVVTIGVAYLQEGIKWEPSYILDLKKTEGTLSLRATLQNPTEKLDGTDVFFVVGSPFVTNRGIQDMFGQLPVAPPVAVPAPAPTSGGERPMEREMQVKAPEKASLTRDEAGELFYYRKPGLSLETRDIAMVSVFQTVVPVTPRYEWNADGEEVSYLLTIKNKSGQPLTTGPVFVLEGGKAIGQENVRYTPAGGNAEIRLAQGIGLKVTKVEAEAKRGDATKIGKTEFIPVTLKGTLTLTNFREGIAALKITKTVRGKVGALSDKGLVKNTQILSGEPNPINDLEWNVEIPAGTTKTITYSFETYMSAERAGAPPVPMTGDPDEKD